MKEQKKDYLSPKIIISNIDSEDIIATSTPYENPNVNNDAWA